MRPCFGRAFLLKKGLPRRWESTCPIARKRAQTRDNPVAGYVLCAPFAKTPCRTEEHSGKLLLQAGGRLERLEFFRLPPVCRLPCRNDREIFHEFDGVSSAMCHPSLPFRIRSPYFKRERFNAEKKPLAKCRESFREIISFF